MVQESFIYSFVARGTMILAEYTEFTGNFPAIASQCLQKIPSSNSKFTFNCDHHTFNFIVEDGYADGDLRSKFREQLNQHFDSRGHSLLRDEYCDPENELPGTIFLHIASGVAMQLLLLFGGK